MCIRDRGRDGQVVARLGCANTGNGELPTLEARVKSFEVFYGPCPADVEAPENAKPRVAIGGVDFTGLTLDGVDAVMADKANEDSGDVVIGGDTDLLTGKVLSNGYPVGRCRYFFRYDRDTDLLSIAEVDVYKRQVGFWADMEHPYVTYDNNFIESEWWALKQIWDCLLYTSRCV